MKKIIVLMAILCFSKTSFAAEKAFYNSPTLSTVTGTKEVKKTVKAKKVKTEKKVEKK